MLRIFVVAVAGVLLTLPACSPPPEDPDPSVGEQLMLSIFEIWESRDLDLVNQLYAEDAVFEDVPDGASYRGHEEIRGNFADDFAAVPDIKAEIILVFASENQGALEWVWSGTQTEDYAGLIPATGKMFSVRGVSVYEFENGKIKRHLDYYDAAGFLQQLGVEFVFPQR